MASRHNVTIGATYMRWEDPGVSNYKYNLVSFWDADGAKLLDYTKRHPVPVTEEFVVRGDIDIIGKGDSTNIGNFNTAICFDFDFPEFIRKSTTSGLLIQTANTWGIVGYFHGINSSFRAIENGTYLARCGAKGPSGLWDPYGNLLSYQPRSGQDVLYFQVPYNPERIWTFYSAVGFVFDYILYSVAILYLILIFVMLKRRRASILVT